MGAVDTAAGLAAFPGRGAGTDAERRCAGWLADQIRAGGRDAQLEPFWCRPNWALAHAWHVTLGLAGSLAAVGSPRVGGALILVALLSVLADELTGLSPGRRLTFEHASQNVVSPAPGETGSETGNETGNAAAGDASTSAQPITRLIITANYDAGRTGLVYRDRIRTITAALRSATNGPGWLGWLAIALAWLLAIAVARLEGSKGTAIGALQLIPTVGLVLALALLLELASADWGPAAGDNGSGVGAAIALAAALDAAPPRHLPVELVLQGAADGSGLGLRRHLRARRRERRPANTIVLGIAPCAAGQPRWWLSDGPFVPLRYAARLRHLCEQIASTDPELQARQHRARGTTPALPARSARLPSITLGCLDDRGLVAHSHQRSDTAQALERQPVDDLVQFALMVVDEIDAHLGSQAQPGPGPTAAVRPA